MLNHDLKIFCMFLIPKFRIQLMTNDIDISCEKNVNNNYFLGENYLFFFFGNAAKKLGNFL